MVGERRGNNFLLDPIRIFITRCYFKINVKEKGKVYDNTAKMQSTNQLGV